MEHEGEVHLTPSKAGMAQAMKSATPAEEFRALFSKDAKYTKADVATVMDALFEECRGLRQAGQKEYAHEDDNPFRNFETLAAELKTTRERILWIYLRKHMDGILAYINGHRSQREPVRGRIKDSIVYLALLAAMVEEDDALPPITFTLE